MPRGPPPGKRESGRTVSRRACRARARGRDRARGHDHDRRRHRHARPTAAGR